MGRVKSDLWRSGAALATTAFVLVGCASQRGQRTSPACPDTREDPEDGCLPEGRGRALREALAQADFEAARLDARSTDWSVYANHPNVYLRGLSLLRLRDQARTADETRLRRVVVLLGDHRPVHTAGCVDLLTSCNEGQGIDFARGDCARNAKSVSALADDVLAAAEPSRVVAAVVAYLAEPGLAELKGGVVLGDPVLHRLREAARKAPRALTDAVAGRMPSAGQEGRSRLLEALSVAPLGSGDARIVGAVAPSMKAKDELESSRAAAAILRLTDQPGLAVASVAGEPRKSAVELLESRFRSGRATRVLGTIGPAAAPLFDSVLAHIDRVRADPSFEGNVVEHATLVGKMGPRAARASRSLLDFAALVSTRGGSSAHYGLPKLIRVLGAIGAPPAELTPFVLSHATDKDLFAAGVGALLAAGAKLGPEELAALKRGAKEHCTPPNHPSAHTGAWDECYRADDDLEKLERIANGEAVEPNEQDPDEEP
jgi:hypothetical protein